jgi:hypothetical protein
VSKANDYIIDFLGNNLYKVTPQGKILTRRVVRGHHTKLLPNGAWREKSIQQDKNGNYITYKGAKLLVKRIVVHAFGLKPKNDEVVYHLDGDHTNCHFMNLMVGSQSEANFNKFNHNPAVIGYFKLGVAGAKHVRDMRKKGLTYKQILEVTSKKYGVTSKGTISYVVNKKTWKETNELSK